MDISQVENPVVLTRGANKILDIRCSEKFRLFRKKRKILGLFGCAVPESSGYGGIFYVQTGFPSDVLISTPRAPSRTSQSSL